MRSLLGHLLLSAPTHLPYVHQNVLCSTRDRHLVIVCSVVKCEVYGNGLGVSLANIQPSSPPQLPALNPVTATWYPPRQVDTHNHKPMVFEVLITISSSINWSSDWSVKITCFTHVCQKRQGSLMYSQRYN